MVMPKGLAQKPLSIFKMMSLQMMLGWRRVKAISLSSI